MDLPTTQEEIKALLAILDHPEAEKAAAARTAIENLVMDTWDKNEKYACLLNGIIVMYHAADLDTLLRTIMDLASRITEAEGASLVRVSPQGDLVFATVVGPHAETVQKMRLPYGEGLVGRCINSGQPLNVADVYREREWAGRDRLPHIETRNLLCVPIISRREHTVLGAIEVVNKQHYTAFSEADINWLKLLAMHVELSLELLVDQTD